MIRRFLAGVALGAFFLWLALRGVDLGEIARTLRGASLPLFSFCVLMHVVTLWVRAARWRVLMRPLAAIPVPRLVPPIAIGFMINFLFPARAGEFVRAWLLGSREAVSRSAAFATIVVERLFDGFAIFCLLGLAPFFMDASSTPAFARIRWAGLLLFAAYAAVLLALVLLSHRREALASFLERSPLVSRHPFAARLAHLVQKFAEGLAVLRSWRDVAVTVAVSLAMWGFAGVTNLAMMRAIDLHLPAYAPFFLVVLQGFGVLIPSPGFVGPFQYAHVVALSVYGVPESVALSLAILVHAGLFIGVLAPGFWYAAKGHLGWRDLKRASREGAGGG